MVWGSGGTFQLSMLLRWLVGANLAPVILAIKKNESIIKEKKNKNKYRFQLASRSSQITSKRYSPFHTSVVHATTSGWQHRIFSSMKVWAMTTSCKICSMWRKHTHMGRRRNREQQCLEGIRYALWSSWWTWCKS